jgi:predicted Zn-dependent protease
VAQYERPKKVTDSAGYAFIRERLRVITAPREADLRPYYAERSSKGKLSLADQYGNALAHLERNEPREAVKILGPLAEEHDELILLQAALGQAQTEAGMSNDALGTFAHAAKLFPRNVPLVVRYAEALMKANKPKQAHEILLDLFNNVPPTPSQIRLTALAASAAGDMGDAYYYMSEYHISSGDLPLASQQLEMALAAPKLTTVQRERFQARLNEIRDFLAEDRRAARARQASTEGGSNQ